MKVIETKRSMINHFTVSLVKSALRIAAGACLCFGLLPLAGTLLVLAEVLGVVEEIV